MAEPLRKVEQLRTILEESHPRPPSFEQLRPVSQGYRLLQFTFTLAPLVAGIDKFLNLLTDWSQYLAPVFPQILGISPQTFMRGVGVIEIIAGIGMIFRPRIFGFIVSAWLVGIIINLLIRGQYYDIALRDLGLALAAFALGLMSMYFSKPHQRQ